MQCTLIAKFEVVIQSLTYKVVCIYLFSVSLYNHHKRRKSKAIDKGNHCHNPSLNNSQMCHSFSCLVAHIHYFLFTVKLMKWILLSPLIKFNAIATENEAEQVTMKGIIYKKLPSALFHTIPSGPRCQLTMAIQFIRPIDFLSILWHLQSHSV